MDKTDQPVMTKQELIHKIREAFKGVKLEDGVGCGKHRASTIMQLLKNAKD